MTHDTGMNEVRLRKALEQLDKFKRVAYNFEMSVVWVINAVKYQTLNANCKVSMWKDMALCSCLELRDKFIAKWGSQIELTAREKEKSPRQVTTIDNIKETLCKGLGNPLQTPSKPLGNPPIGLGTGTGLGLGDEVESLGGEGGVGEGDGIRRPAKPSDEYDCLIEQWEGIRVGEGQKLTQITYQERQTMKLYLQQYRYAECSLAIAWCGDQGWRGTLSQIGERLKSGPHQGKPVEFLRAKFIDPNRGIAPGQAEQHDPNYHPVTDTKKLFQGT